MWYRFSQKCCIFAVDFEYIDIAIKQKHCRYLKK